MDCEIVRRMKGTRTRGFRARPRLQNCCFSHFVCEIRFISWIRAFSQILEIFSPIFLAVFWVDSYTVNLVSHAACIVEELFLVGTYSSYNYVEAENTYVQSYGNAINVRVKLSIMLDNILYQYINTFC